MKITQIPFNKRRAIITMAILSYAVVPVVAGALTQNTTISSIISPVLSVFTTSGTVNINVTPTSGGAQTTASDTVTVSTNDSAGYTLTLSDVDTVTNLVSGGNTVAATTGTQASPIALTAGKWGYRVDSLGGFGAGPGAAINSTAIGAITYAGVPSSASPNQLKSTSTTASNDTTTVWYSVAANTGQATGTYVDTVVYTATAN